MKILVLTNCNKELRENDFIYNETIERIISFINDHQYDFQYIISDINTTYIDEKLYDLIKERLSIQRIMNNSCFGSCLNSITEFNDNITHDEVEVHLCGFFTDSNIIEKVFKFKNLNNDKIMIYPALMAGTSNYKHVCALEVLKSNNVTFIENF